MKKISQKYTIKASPEKVWDALTNPKTIEAWGAGFADMSDKKGYEFKLWGGDIRGKNREVEPQKKLVQEWFGGSWDKASLVTFTLEKKGESTIVTLEQTGVPDAEIEDIADGWKRYYLGEIKKFLET